MSDTFERHLADQCARSFAEVAGAGCVVTDVEGRLLSEYGYGCASCQLCEAAGRRKEACTAAYRQGLTEAGRFGGRYVYLCPMGLGLFATPVVIVEGEVMGITAGPFLMVERADYTSCELEQLHLPKTRLSRAGEVLEKIPEIAPDRVRPLSELLFLAASSIGDVSSLKRLLDVQESDSQQRAIGDTLQAIKQEGGAHAYPLEKENALLRSIADRQQGRTQELLNELLGYILFVNGGNGVQIRSRVLALLTLMSRAAIEGGAEAERILSINDWYIDQLGQMQDVNTLCFWLSAALKRFVDALFEDAVQERIDVIPEAMRYIRKNCDRKLPLGEVAERVYLSPAHFSRLFQQKTGKSFSEYLLETRMEISKRLLLVPENSLSQIAGMVGFADASAFSKAFKRAEGMSPAQYRQTKQHKKT